MKPAPFAYARPRTLDEAVALLDDHRGEAKLLAGGQSLLPLLNMRVIRPNVLVDLGLVEELQVVARQNGELVLGAGVRQRDAETSELVHDACPLIRRALRHVGHVQTRTRGTIGGSLAHAEPTAELPAVAVVLEASLVAIGPAGQRTIPAKDFFVGRNTTALDATEVLTELRVPVQEDARYGFAESARGDIALAAAAIGGGVRLVVAGVAETPIRVTADELSGVAAALAARALSEVDA
jgi:CO/xanthine dehydrogenase FAD-binding subunit